MCVCSPIKTHYTWKFWLYHNQLKTMKPYQKLKIRSKDRKKAEWRIDQYRETSWIGGLCGIKYSKLNHFHRSRKSTDIRLVVDILFTICWFMHFSVWQDGKYYASLFCHNHLPLIHSHILILYNPFSVLSPFCFFLVGNGIWVLWTYYAQRLEPIL